MKKIKFKSLLCFFCGLLAFTSCKKEDKEAPVITLNGSQNMDLAINTQYHELGASATDNEDGNLVPLISGLVNTNIVKLYTLSYTVTDKSGNSAISYRYVNVHNFIDYLAGSYSAHKLGYDSLGNQIMDSTFIQNATASSSINYRLVFTKFANITFAPTSTKINADIDPNGSSLIIPPQSALTKINGITKMHYYRGNGTVSGDSLIQITYYDSLPSRLPNRFVMTLTK